LEICLAVVNANATGWGVYGARGGTGGFLGVAKPQNHKAKRDAKRPLYSELLPGSWNNYEQRVWTYASLDGILYARSYQGVTVIILEVTDMSNSSAAASNSAAAETQSPVCVVYASRKPNGYYVNITKHGVNSALARLPGWPVKDLFETEDKGFEFRLTKDTHTEGRWHLGSDTFKTTLPLGRTTQLVALQIATLEKHSAPVYPPRLG
jgi:hypothetical protein